MICKLDDMVQTMKNPRVYSLYWTNVDKRIVDCQKLVYDKLNIELVQVLDNGKDHGEWMNEVIESHDDQEIFFSDIDAFPMSRGAFDNAVKAVRKGTIVGLAQYSNHTPSKNLYAGPMFLGFQRSTWHKIGSPKMNATQQFDTGELLTLKARKEGIPIKLERPNSTIFSKWALGNSGTFGIGTFYGENSFFHLFESRKERSIALFEAVAEDVINESPLNFHTYLEIFHRPGPLVRIAKKINRKARAILLR